MFSTSEFAESDVISSTIETNGNMVKPELRVTTGSSCPIT